MTKGLPGDERAACSSLRKTPVPLGLTVLAINYRWGELMFAIMRVRIWGKKNVSIRG